MLALSKILSKENSIKQTKNAPFHTCKRNEPLRSAFPHIKLLHFVSSILTMQASYIKQRNKATAHVVFNQLKT